MKRILVPLDGSSRSEAAIPVALLIAKATGAELLFFHVVEASPPDEIHGERHLVDAEAARAYLSATVSSLPPEIKASFHVHEERSQDAAKSIGEHAEELRSDLVVLATHGSHRIGRFLRGSVGQRALLLGGAPVLTLPVHDGRFQATSVFGPWKSMVVTVDGRGEHQLPLAWLGELARSLDMAVELLLVVDTRSSLSGDRATIARSMPGATSWALEAAAIEGETWLGELAASPELAGLRVSTGLLRGGPDKALAKRLKGSDDELVVIGTHGRAGLDALWEGSMAAKMLARLEGPVLLVSAERK